jgi:benzylsuccinate CoA-transferase BbsF subunit
MASHSLQGHSGPRACQRGFGHLASASTGWFDITGRSNELPTGPFSAYTDFISWPVLLSAILVALEMRDSIGRGTYIDHSHVESSAYFAAPEMLMAQRGMLPMRDGNREVYACPNNAYRCCGDDRWCAITVSSDTEWCELCSVLSEQLAAEPRFRTHNDRKTHEADLDAAISGLTIVWEARELADSLAARGVAAGAVYRAQDLFDDLQLNNRRAFRRLYNAEHGPHYVIAPAFRIDDLPSGPNQGFPSLGEHTLHVCRNILCLSEDEISHYAALGVFE